MRTAVAAALLVLVAVSCSGKPAEPEPYSEADMAWIKNLAAWDERYSAQPEIIKPVYTRLLETHGDLGPLRDVLRPFRECAQDLDSGVNGEPEHPQLRRAYEVLQKACAEDRSFAFRLVQTLNPNAAEPPYEVVQTSEPHFLRAAELIEDGLWVNRPLPVRGDQEAESRIDPRLSEAAKAMTLQEIHVRCWSTEDWPRVLKEWTTYSDSDARDAAGFVTGATEIHLAPSSCATLAKFLYADWRPTGAERVKELADAVELVSHEVEHLFETYPGEAETECHAMQSTGELARRLGASRSYASRLTRVYWTDVYPNEEAEYISPECRDGGTFDERPDTDIFP
jgi:hypothetical protein